MPIANIVSTPNRDAIKWSEKSFLYNMNFASKFAARLLYPFGISIDPKQVIIGRDDWLYLGDQHEQTLSVDRRPPTSAEVEIGKQIGAATYAWNAYLSSKGVKLFRIMIGPNKGTIYPEYMPDWAKSASPNATDALLAGTGEILYVDLRGPLLAAKENQPSALYYKTDTHWNILGAGVAFRAFAQQVSAAAPDLRWPSNDVYDSSRAIPRAGGDLARFLRLSANLTDSEPVIRLQDLPVKTTHSDFDTKQIIHKDCYLNNIECFPMIGPGPVRPLQVISEGALNNKKVLWLRDSFGTMMLPMMAATFSDVLQLQWAEAIKPGGRLVQLVEDWKPDYVFFTVVERASRFAVFAAFPPSFMLPSRSDFKPIRTTTSVASNHLMDGGSNSEHHINGNDPFIDFALSDAVFPSEARYLNLDLTCDDGTALVPLQLYWLEEGRPYFDEEHSVRFSFTTGQNLIDLHMLPKWKSSGVISRLRLDIDSQKSCGRFKLNNPSLGLRHSGVDGKN